MHCQDKARTKNAAAHGILFRIHQGEEISKSQLQEAIQLYSEALDLYLNAESYVNLAYLFVAYQDIKSALIFLKSALDLEENNPDALKIIAHIKRQYAVQPAEDKQTAVNRLVTSKEKASNPAKKGVRGLLDSVSKKMISGNDDDFFAMLNNMGR